MQSRVDVVKVEEPPRRDSIIHVGITSLLDTAIRWVVLSPGTRVYNVKGTASRAVDSGIIIPRLRLLHASGLLLGQTNTTWRVRADS